MSGSALDHSRRLGSLMATNHCHSGLSCILSCRISNEGSGFGNIAKSVRHYELYYLIQQTTIALHDPTC